MAATSDAAPSRSRPTRGDDETRAALLAAAHDLLATEGPSALTVRRIANAAGVSTMNVYSRFGGKDGVIDELFVDGFRRMGAAMGDTPETDDPLADLDACGAAYRAFARSFPTYYSLMFDRAVPDFEPSAEALDAALGALGQVVHRVQRAMDAGLVTPGDAFVVATALWAQNHGLASLAAVHVGDDDPFDWDAVAAVSADAMLHGLGPRG